jgi:lysophospholipase L1-like esterase
VQTIDLNADFFEGVVSVEEVDGGLKPWRLPHTQKELFPSPDEALLARAENCSGVRLRFETNAEQIQLSVVVGDAVNSVTKRDAFVFDATIDGELIQSVPVKPGETKVRFADLPAGDKTVEIWLPQDSPVLLREMSVNDGATCMVQEDTRPRWVTYGSSLTHCVRAHSPARIWPAILSRRYDLNLISLGYGGQCCLDAMLGFVIRTFDADFVTLKMGINCIGAGHLSARTYPASAVGLVRVIRETQPETPIVLVSPIGHPPTETTPNPVGYTISGMRTDLKDVSERLIAAGDSNLTYADGLDVFSLPEIDEWAEDECHPNADGIELMAENFDRAVMVPFLPEALGARRKG